MVWDASDLAKSPPSKTLISKIPQKQYSLKNKHTITIFNLLMKKYAKNPKGQTP